MLGRFSHSISTLATEEPFSSYSASNLLNINSRESWWGVSNFLYTNDRAGVHKSHNKRAPFIILRLTGPMGWRGTKVTIKKPFLSMRRIFLHLISRNEIYAIRSKLEEVFTSQALRDFEFLSEDPSKILGSVFFHNFSDVFNGELLKA